MKFIKKYVLCSTCTSPETTYKTRKTSKQKGYIRMKCAACGAKAKLDIDKTMKWVLKDTL